MELTVNLHYASIRLLNTFARFMGKGPAWEDLEAVRLNDFIDYFKAAYTGRVRNAGKKTTAEAACLLAMAFDCNNVVNSATEMILHPLDDTDMLWLSWDKMTDDAVFKMVEQEYISITWRKEEEEE